MRLGLGLGLPSGSLKLGAPITAFPPEAEGTAAILHADFTTEGDTNRYWADEAERASAAAWLTALSGTATRDSAATDLLPSSASGAAYNSYLSDEWRITPNGLLLEGSGENLFIQSGAPVTQDITVGVGTYTLWVNGSGSATSSAGTAIGTQFGAATNGTPNIFLVSGAGTVTITVSGSLNIAQVELGFGSSYIPTTVASVTRAADILSFTLATSSKYTILVSGDLLGLSGSQTFVHYDDGTAGNRVLMFRSGSVPALRTSISSGSSNVATMDNGDIAANTTVKFATAVELDNFATVIDGGTVLTDTAGAIPVSPTTFRLGSTVTGANLLFGHIKDLTIWDGLRAADATMQSLTAP